MAIVGAGGKTTLMFRLARQLAPPVLLTTTTHLGIDQRLHADQHVAIQSPEDLKRFERELPEGVVLITGPHTADGSRLSGLEDENLAALREMALKKGLSLIIEADGSRSLPLKAPAGHEPAIPAWVELVVNVVGLSGLGQPFSPAVVHRFEQFGRLSDLQPMEGITPQALARVLSHPEGGLKNIPAGARKAVLLNQADTQDASIVEELAFQLVDAYDAVLVGHLRSEEPDGEVRSVHERTAGIVLAAGGSTRMGSPKVLLDWNGKPLVRTVVENAIQAKLDPVVVVVGAVKEPVKRALSGVPVHIIENEAWEEGQSTSIIQAVKALPQNTGSAVFLLADQPHIPPELVTELVRLHARTLSPIVCPKIGEKRANPVLFDRVTFDDLLEITGDNGGRQLFDRYALEWLSWDDESILLDIDTRDDYLQLKKLT